MKLVLIGLITASALAVSGCSTLKGAGIGAAAGAGQRAHCGVVGDLHQVAIRNGVSFDQHRRAENVAPDGHRKPRRCRDSEARRVVRSVLALQVAVAAFHRHFGPGAGLTRFPDDPPDIGAGLAGDRARSVLVQSLHGGRGVGVEHHHQVRRATGSAGAQSDRYGDLADPVDDDLRRICRKPGAADADGVGIAGQRFVIGLRDRLDTVYELLGEFQGCVRRYGDARIDVACTGLQQGKSKEKNRQCRASGIWIYTNRVERRVDEHVP